MKNKETAFPVPFHSSHIGISNRLYIATKVACAIIANRNLEKNKSYNDIVKDAYIVADILIEQEETE